MAAMDESARGGDAAPAPIKRRSALSRLLPMLILLLVLGGGGYFAFSQGYLAQFGLGQPKQEFIPQVETPVDLPPMYITMLDRQGRKFQLGVRMRIVLKSAVDAERVQAKLPVVQDIMNTYLRELRLEDLRDRRVGLSRLRQAMLVQFNVELAPIEVKDLLFQDINVQQG